MKNNKNNKRKMAVAVLAGLALTGIIGASAASLGGINGSRSAPTPHDVISCDTDGVDVSYDTEFVRPAATTDQNGMFDVTRSTVSDVNVACDGLDFEVVLLNDANTRLGSIRHRRTLDNLTDDDVLRRLPRRVATGAVDAELVDRHRDHDLGHDRHSLIRRRPID